jgi:hypothetical protein
MASCRKMILLPQIVVMGPEPCCVASVDPVRTQLTLWRPPIRTCLLSPDMH